MMYRIHVIIALAAIVLIAGCVQEQKPITEISLPDHQRIYTFSNDIRQSILVKAPDEKKIHDLFQSQDRISIVFDGTDSTDNGLFRIALFDISSKLPFYLASQGRDIAIDVYYFVQDGGKQWYNFQNEPIEEPQLAGLILQLKGPATGANETSVTLENTTVTLQGASRTGISMAADKLVLVVFGIDSIDKIAGTNSSESSSQLQFG